MKRAWLSILALCVPAWGASACGGKNSNNVFSDATGGSAGTAAGGTGGDAGSGGTGGDADSTVSSTSSGGTSSGSGGNAGSAGSAGDAGSGGTGGSVTLTCDDDGDCDGATPHCEPLMSECVACFTDDQCEMDERCVGNSCESACASDDDCEDPEPLCNAGGVCVQCEGAADCADDEVCSVGTCVPVDVCGNSLDCPAGEVCDEDLGQCVACAADGDCSDSEVCVENACVRACDTDRICTPMGQLCDLDLGRCVQCVSHSDCPDAAHCEEGTCVVDNCTPELERCGNGVIEQCDSEGIGYATVETCESNQTCSDDGSGASCETWVCTPSATECQTNRIVVECSDDGLNVLSSLDCEPEGQYCVNGECSDQVCIGDELFCNDGDVHLCDSDGLGSVVSSSCGSQQYCDDSGTPTCQDWVCTPDEPYCQGNTALLCNAEGSAPVSEGTACASDQTCLDGVCEDQVCEPDTAECSGSFSRLVCASDGLSESVIDCANNEYCDTDTSACEAQVCQPNQPACNGNATTTCNSNGSGYTGGESDCGDQTCFAGACQDAYLLEDFEDGDFDGWEVGATAFTRTVTNAQAADGTTYSLQLTGGANNHYGGLNYLFEDIQPTYVSYWARPTTSGSTTYFVLSQSTDSDPVNQIAFVYFTLGEITVAGPDVSLGAFSVNQWYHIEMDIDWTNKTLDFSVNDVPVQADVPFRAPSVNSIAMLSLYHYDSSTGYWDEIEVR